MISRHVRRVDQLDSVSLDRELFTLLNAQYRKAFAFLPNFVITKAGPELDVLFRLIFKYMPLKYLGGTFGQNVFDLKYLDGKSNSPASINKLRFLAVLNVALPWFWDRMARPMFQSSYDLERTFHIVWKILTLINFCVFLQTSTFSTVIERVLCIRPFYSSPQEIKPMQFDGIGRELMWHGLSEFLGFTLPLINVFRIKNYLKHMWFSWSAMNSFKFRVKNDYCLICEGIPNYPHSMGCAHIFCYYCLASMLLVDPSFKCVHCNLSASGFECMKAVPINRPEINK